MRVKHQQTTSKRLKRYCSRHRTFVTMVFLLFIGIIGITGADGLFGDVSILGLSHNASALTYQDTIDLKYKLNPSISITVSDLTIPGLTPGDGSDSNIITVGVSSNAIAGYTLGSSVGSTDSGSSYYGYGTDLRLSSSDNTNKFTNLGSSSAADLASFNPGDWGYSYSTDSGTSWVYGNTGSASSGYGGYVSTATNITHINTTTPGDSSIQYKIGAKATTSQIAGAYTNIINFTGVANVVATSYALSYVDNSGEATNMPASSTTGNTDDGTFAISDTIPTRSNYTFRGWCTEDNSADTTACSGDLIRPGGLYSTGTTSSTFTGSVYTVWGNTLYNKVASLVKTYGGSPQTQTLSDMQAVITEPTSNDPATDTSNSGVFLYDASTFGTASDASNDYDIYYYRGQLDQNFTSSDSYGGRPSTGDSYYYPNYVVLSGAKTKSGITTNDTCWRITRTTGSGGVKMIYNGKWTGSTCANVGNNAAAGTAYFNRGAGYESTPDSNCDTADNAYCGTLGFTTMVGYNYNSTYVGESSKSYTSPISNGILFNNETPSNARTRIETWFNSTNLTTYAATNRLETDAGWCDDRTTTASPSVNDTTVPYSTGWLPFGARYRNVNVGGQLTLTCPNPTGNDLLTTSNGLGAPLAPLTEDEAALAGHGLYHHYVTPNTGPDVESELSSNYAYQSFLRSGSVFWLLSPYYRHSDGLGVFYVHSVGYSGPAWTFWTTGLRPAISLTPGTTVASGAGTSTDPWIVNP